MEEVVAVFEQYGADPAVLDEYDCVPLRARIVRDVLKLRTATGTRAFKKVPFAEPRLRYVHQCLEFAAAHGMPRVPRLIRNRYGDAYVNHPSGLYCMTAWLPGRAADFRKPNELLAGARLLGGWQRLCADFRPLDVPAPVVRSVQERLAAAADDCRQAVDQAAHSDNPTSFQRLLLAAANEIRERCDMADACANAIGLVQLEASARLAGRMCHGNFHRQSVVYDGAAWSVIHYDGVHPGLPISDFAFLCHRYLPAYEWDVDIFVQAVDSYREAAVFTREDGAVLDALLAVPMRTLQVVSWYHRGAKDWDEEDFVDYLETSLSLEELREEARAALHEHACRTGVPRLSAGHDTQGEGWQTATFTIGTEETDTGFDQEVARQEAARRAAPANHGAPDDTPLELQIQTGDTTEQMEIADVKDGMLVVRPTQAGSAWTRSNARRKRRRRTPRGFSPVHPGLRLWSADEHRREDDKE